MYATVSGTYYLQVSDDFKTLQQQNIYLSCDTSQAPARIILPPIADLGGFLNAKIYVSDSSNNASTNSITISVSGSETINLGSSETINTNSGSAMIVITSKTQYAMMSNVSSGAFLSSDDTIALINALG